ncbi:MAG: AtpZ/AtpI family protein [Acidobacteria bacterium]|nr:AtpZ/AtpI family protein [Acidobacteriota bacterium]
MNATDWAGWWCLCPQYSRISHWQFPTPKDIRIFTIRVYTGGSLLYPATMKEEKDGRQKRILAELTSVGIQFPVSIGIGYLMGRYLDKWFHLYPVLTIVFSLFGVAAAFINVFRLNAELNRLEREEREEKEKK